MRRFLAFLTLLCFTRFAFGADYRFTNGDAVFYGTNRILNTDGSVAAPSYGFKDDPDSGLYPIGANNIGIAVGGSKILDIGAAGLGITGTLTAPSGGTFGGTFAGAVTWSGAQTFNAGATSNDTFTVTKSGAETLLAVTSQTGQRARVRLIAPAGQDALVVAAGNNASTAWYWGYDATDDHWKLAYDASLLFASPIIDVSSTAINLNKQVTAGTQATDNTSAGQLTIYGTINTGAPSNTTSDRTGLQVFGTNVRTSGVAQRWGTTLTGGALVIDTRTNNTNPSMSFVLNSTGDSASTVAQSVMDLSPTAINLNKQVTVSAAVSSDRVMYITNTDTSATAQGLKIKSGGAAGAGVSTQIPFIVSNAANTADYFAVRADGSFTSYDNNNVAQFVKSATGAITAGPSGFTGTHSWNGDVDIPDGNIQVDEGAALGPTPGASSGQNPYFMVKKITGTILSTDTVETLAHGITGYTKIKQVLCGGDTGAAITQFPGAFGAYLVKVSWDATNIQITPVNIGSGTSASLGITLSLVCYVFQEAA